MDLSCIIVTYKQGDRLGKCVQALYDAAPRADIEICIVNNDRRESLETLQAEYPGIRIVTNPSNAGFARANNQAARQARGEVLLFLNPDAVLHPGSIPRMMQHLREHPDIGILAPRVLNPDGTVQASCRRFPNLWTGLFNRYSLPSRLFPNNRFTREYLLQDFDHNTTRDVDWVSGCCMMMPRKVFFELGGFDETYFLFNEDVDLCRTAWQAGYRVVYHPEAGVTHEIGSSHAKLPAKVIVKRHRGMVHYWRKHMRPHPVTGGLVEIMVTLRCGAQLVRNWWK